MSQSAFASVFLIRPWQVPPNLSLTPSQALTDEKFKVLLENLPPGYPLTARSLHHSEDKDGREAYGHYVSEPWCQVGFSVPFSLIKTRKMKETNEQMPKKLFKVIHSGTVGIIKVMTVCIISRKHFESIPAPLVQLKVTTGNLDTCSSFRSSSWRFPVSDIVQQIYSSLILFSTLSLNSTKYLDVIV